MRKLFILIVIFLGGLTIAYGQEERPDKKDKDPVKKEKMFREVQEFKMKYIAQEMDLSEVQKKRFYELYEEMNESKKECYQEAVVMDRRLKEEKNASDEDYQQVRTAFNEANAKWAEIQKEYDEKFSEFLSPKQMYKMKEGEENFRAKFDEMKHSRRKSHHKKNEAK